MPFSSTRDILQHPYTETLNSFNLPSVGGTVTISCKDSTVLNRWIFVESLSNAAILRITAKPSSTQITAANDGTLGNATPGTSFNAGAIIHNSARPGDAGQSSYTVTTANFTVPNTNANVQIAVGSTSWVSVDQPIFIGGAGHYRVVSVDSDLLVTAKNLGLSGNAAPSSTINSGAKLSSDGERGATGSVAATDSLSFNGAIAPPSTGSSERKLFINSSDSNNPALREPNDGTTKRLLAIAPTGLASGDLFYYNGTDLVRLGLGTLGQVLSAGASAPQWANPSQDILSSDRSYYIDPTSGSNSNSGLSSGVAFATIQKFYDVIAKLNLNGFKVTGNLVNQGASHNPGATINCKSPVGEGEVILEASSPSNFHFNYSGFSGNATLFLIENQPANFRFKNFKITDSHSSASGQHLFFTATGGKTSIKIQGVEFGAMTSATTFKYHVMADQGAFIDFLPPYTISGGNTRAHWYARNGGKITCQNGTITLTGTPAWVASGETIYGFATAEYVSLISAYVTGVGVVFSGSATGSRYGVRGNAVVNSFGAGANAFPGNTTILPQSGGEYL